MFIHVFLLLTVCRLTIQLQGVVVSLPVKVVGPSTHKSTTSSPTSHKSTKGKPAASPALGEEIHTWKNVKPGYTLECRISLSTPGHYQARVLYEGVQLEAVEVTRFDGELTKSVTIKSTNDSMHLVRYLKVDRTCMIRAYTAVKEGQGFDWKEEECEFPGSVLSLHKTKFRNNGWIWGQSKWENWDKTMPGRWKGAIASLPTTEAVPDPDLSKSLKLHTWTNVMPGYQMTVYRVTKDSLPLHYIAIYYHMELLQSGVQITKFDDTLLNSVSVSEPSGPLKDHYEVQYKFHDGSCKDRLYSYALEKATSTKVSLEVAESTCQRFTAYKAWTYISNIDAINGWLY